MKAVLFDLDDTLYPELDFVKGGFKAVAAYLSARYHLDEAEVLGRIFDILDKDGRGRVFDTLLEELGHYTDDRAKLLVYLYRSHRPTIQLYEDVLPTLRHIKEAGMDAGIITDGMASVQRNKLAALGLDELLPIAICTDELGREHWKPSVLPYKIALDLLDVQPAEAIYVGDNTAKDFVGPNALGMLSVQIQRHAKPSLEPSLTAGRTSAKFVIKGLSEIFELIPA